MDDLMLQRPPKFKGKMEEDLDAIEAVKDPKPN
jgi:hypothetical protein